MQGTLHLVIPIHCPLGRILHTDVRIARFVPISVVLEINLNNKRSSLQSIEPEAFSRGEVVACCPINFHFVMEDDGETLAEVSETLEIYALLAGEQNFKS